MTKTGVLMHARHPSAMNWEELVWGDSSRDKLGDGPKLVELLLRESPDAPIAAIVVGTSAATKDGLLEGEYTKKFLLDKFDTLDEFPRLHKLLSGLTSAQRETLRARLEAMIVTQILKNTDGEVAAAAQIFQDRAIDQVIQITAATHGPRCIQAQAVARAKGDIPDHQLWFVVVTDMSFQDSDPLSTLVLENPHRGDDPMCNFKPSAPEALRGFLKLQPEDKKEFIHLAKQFIDEKLGNDKN